MLNFALKFPKFEVVTWNALLLEEPAMKTESNWFLDVEQLY